jgi:hypothetical protein
VRALRDAGPGTAAATVRFVENFGAEHVLHVGYGEDLLRVVAPPGFAAVGETVHLVFDLRRVHLIDGSSDRAVPFERAEAAA